MDVLDDLCRRHPLKLGSSEVRLLRFYPSYYKSHNYEHIDVGDDAIYCSVEVYPIDAASTKLFTIFVHEEQNGDLGKKLVISGYVLCITQDLHRGLVALRSQTEDKYPYLWIQKFCLNAVESNEIAWFQSNKELVFQSASSIIIWPGSLNEEDGRLLHHIVSIGESAFQSGFRPLLGAIVGTGTDKHAKVQESIRQEYHWILEGLGLVMSLPHDVLQKFFATNKVSPMAPPALEDLFNELRHLQGIVCPLSFQSIVLSDFTDKQRGPFHSSKVQFIHPEGSHPPTGEELFMDFSNDCAESSACVPEQAIDETDLPLSWSQNLSGLEGRRYLAYANAMKWNSNAFRALYSRKLELSNISSDIYIPKNHEIKTEEWELFVRETACHAESREFSYANAAYIENGKVRFQLDALVGHFRVLGNAIIQRTKLPEAHNLASRKWIPKPGSPSSAF
jgi:hypothetical protein